MRLMAALLMVGMMASQSAMAHDRSDAMLRAFQEACFPHLDDIVPQRKRISEAGFVDLSGIEPVLRDLDLQGKTVIFDSHGGKREVVPETHYRQRDGFKLFLTVVKDLDFAMTSCAILDLEAAGPVNERNLADWIGRPADESKPAFGAQHRKVWKVRSGALPGGYSEIASQYSSGHPCCSGAEIRTTHTKVP
jgi:hypothetical protein